MRLKIIISVFLYFSPLTYADNFDWSYILGYKTNFDQKQFNLSVITPATLLRNSYGPVDAVQSAFFMLSEASAAPEDLSQATGLLIGKAQDRYIDILKNRWQQKTGANGQKLDFTEMENAFKTSEKLNDGRSSFIIISSPNDILDVRAMIRLSVKDAAHPSLPFRQRLGLPADPVTTKFLETSEPAFQLDRTAPHEPFVYLKSFWWSGGEIEIKSWVKDPKETADLVPLLLYAAEIHHLTRRSGENVQFDSWPPQDPEIFKKMNAIRGADGKLARVGILDQLFEKQPFLKSVTELEGISQLELRPSELKDLKLSEYPTPLNASIVIPGKNSKTMGKRVSTYFAESDGPELARVYRSMGFTHVTKVKNPNFTGSYTDVWKISREKFVDNLKPTVMRRPGGKELTGLELEYIPDYYQHILEVSRKHCEAPLATIGKSTTP